MNNIFLSIEGHSFNLANIKDIRASGSVIDIFNPETNVTHILSLAEIVFIDGTTFTTSKLARVSLMKYLSDAGVNIIGGINCKGDEE